MTKVKFLSLAGSMILSANVASASVLSCQTSISSGEGQRKLDDQSVEISVSPYMVAADLPLKSAYGYTLSASVRADRVVIYAQGNGVMLSATGQNLAELNLGKANFTNGFVVGCAIK